MLKKFLLCFLVFLVSLMAIRAIFAYYNTGCEPRISRHEVIEGMTCDGDDLGRPQLVSSEDECGAMLDNAGRLARAAVFTPSDKMCQLKVNLGNYSDSNLGDYALIVPRAMSSVRHWRPVLAKDTDSSKVIVDSTRIATAAKAQAICSVDDNCKAYVLNQFVDSNGVKQFVGGTRSDNSASPDTNNPAKEFFTGVKI